MGNLPNLSKPLPEEVAAHQEALFNDLSSLENLVKRAVSNYLSDARGIIQNPFALDVENFHTALKNSAKEQKEIEQLIKQMNNKVLETFKLMQNHTYKNS